MARPNNITVCSFCGKSHAEVKKLIVGPGVYICDNCVTLFHSEGDKVLPAENRKAAATAKDSERVKELCSFCGKSHAEVKKLVAGPGVFICDKCVTLCKSVLDKEFAADARKKAAQEIPGLTDGTTNAIMS